MAKLRIARNLSLPVDVVTQTVAYIGRKGSGKSYGAGKLVELIYDMGAPVVVVEGLGNWYGLRLAADGKSPGLSIPVFGGEHGDVPLGADSGATVGRLLVEKQLSAVLDVSAFHKKERKRFVADFAEALFRSAKSVRRPMMIIFEEAQMFAPEQCRDADARMLGAVQDIVRLGRNYGLGSTLITQRPQSVSKEVLNQVECLFVGQLSGSHERKAIKNWIVATGADQAEGYLHELPSLATGTMYCWSPQWLRTFKKVRIEKKRTYDSTATPKLGRRQRKPAKLAPVDIKALGKEFEGAIERAKADDPKLLRKRIAELEREAAKKPAVAEAERVEIPIFDETAFRELTRTAFGASAHIEDAKTAAQEAGEVLQRLLDALDVYAKSVMGAVALGEKGVSRPHPQRIAAPKRSAPPRQTNGDASVGTGGLRRILVALAQRPQGLTNKQIGVRAGLSSRSGTFSTYVSRGRTQGWIEGRGVLTITDAGKTALGEYTEQPSGPALLNYWLGELGNGGASRLLRVIAEAYPRALTNVEAGEAAGLSHRSGTFSTYLSRLRTLQLIEGRGELQASEELF